MGVERRPLAERFWPKVDRRGPEDCWLWTAGQDAYGYGSIRRGGRREPTLKAHRVAYELATGETIPDGLCVLHDCDNPPCCNPAHLFLGTQADNLEDMARKGRGKSGRLPYGVKAHRARYVAQVFLSGKQCYLGMYATVEEAHRVALQAKRDFYAPNGPPKTAERGVEAAA